MYELKRLKQWSAKHWVLNWIKLFAERLLKKGKFSNVKSSVNVLMPDEALRLQLLFLETKVIAVLRLLCWITIEN